MKKEDKRGEGKKNRRARRRTEAAQGIGAPTRPIVLIGNKIDMERERGVTFESGVLLAERIGAQAFIEM